MILAIDTETTGTDRWHGCRPFMFQACDGKNNYHFIGKVNPFDRRDVQWNPDDLAEIQTMLDDASVLVYHNAKFDIHMLQSIGIKIDHLWRKTEDTILAHHCLSSGESHKLKYLAFKYMDYYNEDEQKLEAAVREIREQRRREGWDVARAGHPSFPGISGQRVQFWKMDYWVAIDECIEYGLSDVERTWGLWSIFYDSLINHDLTHQYQVRRQLLQIAFDMECVGYNCYHEDISDEIQYLSDRKEALIDQMKHEVKLEGEFDPNKPAHLSKFLFDILGLTPTKLTESKGEPSLAKEVINELIEANPNTPALQHYKNYSIADTQIGYLNSYLKWTCPDGRIRASVFITGTRETRQAYRDPNLQNIDKRLRYLFGPGKGKIWIDFDLVNIEMRIWVYQVGSKELVEIFDTSGSVHNEVAKILYPEEWEHCVRTKQEFKKLYKNTYYQWVKNGNFAIIYGATERKADETYHVKGAYKKVAARFPEVPAYTSSIIQEMWDNFERDSWPHVTCIGGYKLDVPPDDPFKACNYKIQGTAGWIVGEAMINCKHNPDYIRTGCQMIQQVHDSIVFEVDVDQFSDKLVQSLKHSIELAGLQYLPTCEASYDVIYNETDCPF